MQNAVPEVADRVSAAPVEAAIAERGIADRRAAYASEARRLIDAAFVVMRRTGSIDPPVRAIVQAVHDALERIPPELSADIFDRGVALCGGSVLLRNFDRCLRQETSLPVKIVDQPLSAVVLGAGKMLEDRKLLKRLAA